MAKPLREPIVLHQDDALLAVHKPPGMPTVVGRGTQAVSCRHWLALRLFGGDLRRVLPVHRIDRDTSGMLLFALTKLAQSRVSVQFQNRLVSKRYLAITRGGPPADNGLVEVRLGPDKRDLKRSRVDPKHGVEASTEYQVLERFRGFCLVACMPKTGRRHQLRLHLKALGCPLAVDPLYTEHESLSVAAFKRGFTPGAQRVDLPPELGSVRLKPLRGEGAVIRRLTLHAERLTITHPVTGEPTCLVAEPPKDFSATLTQLRKWARLT